MSLQNLLEMDSFSQPSSLNDKNSDRPRPKPRPRTKMSKLALSPSRRKERDIDDVMSLSSENDNRDQQFSSRKGKYGATTSVSAFDNNAFVSDEEQEADSDVSNQNQRAFTSSKKPPLSPKRNSQRVSSPTFRNLQKGSASSHLRNSSSDGEKEDSDEDRSDVTYTVENETKPTSSKTSKLQRGSRKLQRSESPATTQPKSKPDRKKSGKREDTAESTSSKKKDDHVSIDVESETPNKGEKKEDKPDKTEAIPVSSAAKGSVKARFGKLLFGSQTAESRRKIKTPLDSPVEKESAPIAKDKSSFVNRWKGSLLKPKKHESVSESVDEGDAKDTEADETLGEVKAKDSPRKEVREKVKAKKSSTDTRIIVPDDVSDEEVDNASVKSYSSEEEEKEMRSPKGQVIDSKRKVIDSKSEHQSDLDTVDEEKEKSLDEVTKIEEKEAHAKKTSFDKLKPLARIWRGKSKSSEREREQTTKPIDTIEEGLTHEEETPREKEKSKDRKDKVEAIKPEPGPGPEHKQRQQRKDLIRKPSRMDNLSAPVTTVTEPDSDFSKSESDSESEKVEKVEKRKEKSPRREPKIRPREPVVLTDSNSGKDLLFGLTIHQSDLLPMDPNVIHPVVKITVMYQNGQYLKRSENLLDVSKSERDKSEKKKGKRRKSSENLFTENVADSVMSIMSQPCHARYSIPTFAPTWNELLVFEEPFKRFAVPDAGNDSEKEPILFFEIMDFLPMNSYGNSVSVSGFHGTDAGWYKVAWAFLKPIGANGALNLNKKIRLQLYKPVKVGRKQKSLGPEVYSWWKCGKREKISSTLYVTPKGIIPPETRAASLRQLLSMRKEQLTQAILDSQLATKKKERSLRQSVQDLRDLVNWSRMEGQSCKPPNKLVATLPTSQIESLNIVISGNVHCTKFSPCGRKLAAGLDTDELHVILIFEVPSWTLLKTLKGHHGIIYEITWKIFELNDDTSVHYLASASSDATVRIWKMENHNERTIKLVKVLHHPSYVYAVKFHPTHPSIVATGCFDCIIRVWDFKPEHSEPSHRKKEKSSRKHITQNEVSPIILLDKHQSFVNCLLFDHGGQHLFSGDGAACLYRWSCSSPSQKKNWKLERDARLYNGDVPVNSIDLHPSGNRILVQLRDNFIKVLDVVTFIPLQTFSGLSNERFQIRSCFSPCGNLVLSGSEDSTLCIWDADTGKILQFVCPRNHPHCIVSCVDYHPFDYYIAVGVASAISEPSPILIYFNHQPARMSYPMLKKSAMRFKASLEKSRSQSSDSLNNNMIQDGRQSRRDGPFETKRGDSSEKFISIIHKLDTALYFAQQRNKKRMDEMKQSTCISNTNIGESQEARLFEKGESNNMEKVKVAEEVKASKENVPGKSSSITQLYCKRSNERPRSASSATKEKRERFRKSRDEVKSDSEQSHKQKREVTLSGENGVTQLTSSFRSTGRVESSQERMVVSSVEQDFRPKPLKRRSKLANTTEAI